jgi:hypothetical protein
MEAYTAGTLAGAGSFHCEHCGYAIATHERDVMPSCPRCHSDTFERSSMFAVEDTDSWGAHEVERPEWLQTARESLVTRGDYLAYDDGERVRIVPLQEGWTRLGRSLAAHVRFDDPTVSRRHALLYRDDDGARILDDRSLNGVFRNGDRVELAELEDGDEIQVGRFRLFFVSMVGSTASAAGPLHA